MALDFGVISVCEISFPVSECTHLFISQPTL